MKPPEQQKSDLTPGGLGRLIELRLKARLAQGTSSTVATHPDDDLINAFVEGELSETESQVLVAHLVECASCLHLTAEVVRHEDMTDEIMSLRPTDEQPGPLQRFINSLASGIPSPNEDAVFAYQEKEDAQPADDNADADADP